MSRETSMAGVGSWQPINARAQGSLRVWVGQLASEAGADGQLGGTFDLSQDAFHRSGSWVFT